MCAAAPTPIFRFFVRLWLFGMPRTWQHGGMKKLIGTVLVLALAGCATGINPKKYNNAPVTPENFKLCHGYSCTHMAKAGFTAKQWKSIAAIFKSKSKNAAAERSKIAKAVAKMEQYSGAKTGTDEDLPMAGSIKESDRQLDCIDETINTTNYLTRLQDAKLLKFHEVGLPTHRGYLIDGRWPHNTAVIRQTEGNVLYAVDSFYRTNGDEPYILPRQQWLEGWKPPGANQ